MTNENEKTVPRVFQSGKNPQTQTASETTLQRFMRVSGLPKRPAKAMLDKASQEHVQAVDAAKEPAELVAAVKELQAKAGEDYKASIDTTESIETPPIDESE